MTQLVFHILPENDVGGCLLPGRRIVLRVVDYLTTCVLAEILAGAALGGHQ